MNALAVLRPKWHYIPTRTKKKWRLISYGVDALTRREEQVVMMLAGGLGSSEIAKELGISQKTVWTYRARAMETLGVGSVAMLAYLLEARGKIQNPFTGEPNG